MARFMWLIPGIIGSRSLIVIELLFRSGEPYVKSILIGMASLTDLAKEANLIILLVLL
jgi:hypothetical protein